MKTRQDDFSTTSHNEEDNVAVSVTFRGADGGYYKADLDMSPASFLRVIKNNAVRPIQFQKYIKHSTEEEKKQYNGRAGHYEPAKNVVAMIASLVEEKPTV